VPVDGVLEVDSSCARTLASVLSAEATAFCAVATACCCAETCARAVVHPFSSVGVDGAVVVVVVVVVVGPEKPEPEEPEPDEPVGEEPVPVPVPEPVPVPVPGAVTPQVVSAWERSAASCCWSADAVACVATTAAWSWVISLEPLPLPPDLPPAGDEDPVLAGVVVGVVVVVVVEVWLSSSAVSWASSDATEDSADDTASASDVVSSVPSDSPAVTCSPTVAVTVATWPATWKEAEALVTGSTVPTTSWLSSIVARVTLAIR